MVSSRNPILVCEDDIIKLLVKMQDLFAFDECDDEPFKWDFMGYWRYLGVEKES